MTFRTWNGKAWVTITDILKPPLCLGRACEGRTVGIWTNKSRKLSIFLLEPMKLGLHNGFFNALAYWFCTHVQELECRLCTSGFVKWRSVNCDLEMGTKRKAGQVAHLRAPGNSINRGPLRFEIDNFGEPLIFKMPGSSTTRWAQGRVLCSCPCMFTSGWFWDLASDHRMFFRFTHCKLQISMLLLHAHIYIYIFFFSFFRPTLLGNFRGDRRNRFAAGNPLGSFTDSRHWSAEGFDLNETESQRSFIESGTMISNHFTCSFLEWTKPIRHLGRLAGWCRMAKNRPSRPAWTMTSTGIPS